MYLLSENPMNSIMYQSMYEGSQSARHIGSYKIPVSVHQRSISLPRRKNNTFSLSPLKVSLYKNSLLFFLTNEQIGNKIFLLAH